MKKPNIKHLFTILPIILTILYLSSCTSPPKSEIESIPQISGNELVSILDTTSIIIDTSTSEYLIIPLETTNYSLIGDGTKIIAVTDDYILVENNEGLLQFNKSGRFIRQIMRKGKGPNEYIYVRPYTSYKNDFIFHDSSKRGNRLNRCNLETGEVSNFPIAIDGLLYNVSVLSDSTIAIYCDTFKENGHQSQMYFQDLHGNLLTHSEIGSNYSFHTFIRAARGLSRIQKCDETSAIIESPYCDSLVRYSEKYISPILYITELPRITLNKVYERFLKVSFIHYSKKYILLKKDHLSITKRRIKPIDSRLLVIDPVSMKPSIIKSFRIEELNLDIYPEDISFENTSFGVAEYSANDFKDKIEISLSKDKLDIRSKKILEELDGNIRREDNPILVVWKL